MQFYPKAKKCTSERLNSLSILMVVCFLKIIPFITYMDVLYARSHVQVIEMCTYYTILYYTILY